MRKKTIGIVICTLVIATALAPIVGSTNISQLHFSSNPEFPLKSELNYAFSKIGSNLDNWGISDSISLGSAEVIRLYYAHKYDISGSDKGFLKISTNGGSSWTTLEEFQGKIEQWDIHRLDISDYSGKTILIGFHYVTESESVSQGWSIDMILIEEGQQGVYSEDFEEYDNNDPWGDWIVKRDETPPPNYPPYPPSIEGPNNGKKNELLNFSFYALDLNLDDVSFYIEWGDGNVTDWTDYNPSASGYNEGHIWTEEGTYTINVKAKDINKAESEWTEKTVKIKKGRDRQSNSFLFTEIFERLFEQLCKSFPVLNRIIEF